MTGRRLTGLLLGCAAVAATAIQAQSPVTALFKRGEVVRVREVTSPAVMKIVGLPDEIVQVDASGVYANDVQIPGFSKDFLSRNNWPRQIVPFGHYFVIGEPPPGEKGSAHLGIHPEETIERAE
ncbi:MAG TPA: hypothetical protein VM818_11835 [Vicinamibacterales bacterium]|nr:hypothetical protein [Vicinamibacterales bacterium]